MCQVATRILHHIDGYGINRNKSLLIENGITLCDEHHRLSEKSFHKMYGFKNANKDNFIEWLNLLGVKIPEFIKV
mgnify:CR=1 FL=1